MGNKHTKGELASIKNKGITAPLDIISSNGKRIACIVWGIGGNTVDTYEEVEANAERIVKAWNSFDDLVEALESVVIDLDNHPSYSAAEHYKPLIDKVKKALKKAISEEPKNSNMHPIFAEGLGKFGIK